MTDALIPQVILALVFIGIGYLAFRNFRSEKTKSSTPNDTTGGGGGGGGGISDDIDNRDPRDPANRKPEMTEFSNVQMEHVER